MVISDDSYTHYENGILKYNMTSKSTETLIDSNDFVSKYFTHLYFFWFFMFLYLDANLLTEVEVLPLYCAYFNS